MSYTYEYKLQGNNQDSWKRTDTVTGHVDMVYINPTIIESTVYNANDQPVQLPEGGGGAWGSITGTLTSQTDLQNALNSKQATLVSATNIKTVNGSSLLGSGDLVIGGAVVITSFEQNLGSTPTWRGKFTVVDAAVNTSTKIQIWQRFAALTGKGTRADENEMDTLIVNAEAGTGQFTVYWQTQPQYITSRILREGNAVRTSASALTPYQDAFIYGTKRIGKVKGNFKFNYIIA